MRHLKIFLFHLFLNIWYFLSDILSDTLSDSCSAASKTNRLFAANLIPLLLWIHKKISQMFSSAKLAHIAGLLKIHTCPIREFWSNLTKTTKRRWLSDNIGALKTWIQRRQSGDLNMRDLIESISAEIVDALRGRDLFLETKNVVMTRWIQLMFQSKESLESWGTPRRPCNPVY